MKFDLAAYPNRPHPENCPISDCKKKKEMLVPKVHSATATHIPYCWGAEGFSKHHFFRSECRLWLRDTLFHHSVSSVALGPRYVALGGSLGSLE
jgi:hypothetical protein